LVLFLFFCLIYRMLKVVLRSKDLYSSLVAFGLAAQIFFNAIINIGMVIGMLPVVGLPLPLFSYGGTSLLSTMFAVGIVLGVSMRRLSFASRS
ncbi:MAG: FtsW/RodA/SpoVE family cell cycle protein, partial [Bdellovibrionales bacterium]|nr:FtsW/RodA/SpoVE family cell cycle protein [Bdellovibrionales bacterium]